MTLPVELIEQVRQRAKFACEYCSVTETDNAGQWTVVANVVLNFDAAMKG